MHRRLVSTAAVAAALVTGAACAAPTAAPTESAPAVEAAASVRVGLVEWGFTTSAAALVAGPVELEVTNAGSTPHDMQVLVDDEVVASTTVLAPGEQQTLRADLAGVRRATLLCTLPGHESQGMVRQIDVVESSAIGTEEGTRDDF